MLGSSNTGGALASAARMTCAVRSSARTSVSDPLPARPIGERAVATMTASGDMNRVLHGARLLGRGRHRMLRTAPPQAGPPAPASLGLAVHFDPGDLRAGVRDRLHRSLRDRTSAAGGERAGRP